jgi:hypothetical protein
VPDIHLEDPDLVASLADDLRRRPDFLVESLNETTLRVTLVGSYRLEQMQFEVALRVRIWEEAERAKANDVHVEIR